MKIIQSHADLATHHRNPPQPPFAKGGRGDFWVILSEGKSYLFQKAKVLQEIFFIRAVGASRVSRDIAPLQEWQVYFWVPPAANFAFRAATKPKQPASIMFP